MSKTDSVARLWDVATGEQVKTFDGPAKDLTYDWFNPSGTQAITGKRSSSMVNVWSTTTGALLYSLDHHTREVIIVVYSPDGKYMVTADADASLNLWDALSGTFIRSLIGHTQVPELAMPAVTMANFSSDSKYLVTSGVDGTARIWPVEGTQSQVVDITDNTFTIWPGTLSTSSVTFDTTLVGRSRDITVTALLRNPDSVDLPLSALSISGLHAASFSILSDPAPLAIPAHGSYDLHLRFAPSTVGEHIATLTAVAGGDTFRVSLKGIGRLQPLISLADTLDLGRVPLNRSRDTIVAVLENVSDSIVVLDSLRFDHGEHFFQIRPNDRVGVDAHSIYNATLTSTGRFGLDVADTLWIYHRGTTSPERVIVVAEGELPAGVTSENGSTGVVSLECIPNPSRNRLTLSYETVKRGHVRVSLHDMLGREVRVVADGYEPSGRHSVEVDVGSLAAGNYMGVVEVDGARVQQVVQVVR